MRHRDRIPELAVMAIDQEPKRWPDMHQMGEALDCYFANPAVAHWVAARDAEAGHGSDLELQAG